MFGRYTGAWAALAGYSGLHAAPEPVASGHLELREGSVVFHRQGSSTGIVKVHTHDSRNDAVEGI